MYIYIYINLFYGHEEPNKKKRSIRLDGDPRKGPTQHLGPKGQLVVELDAQVGSRLRAAATSPTMQPPNGDWSQTQVTQK